MKSSEFGKIEVGDILIFYDLQYPYFKVTRALISSFEGSVLRTNAFSGNYINILGQEYEKDVMLYKYDLTNVKQIFNPGFVCILAI